MILPVLALVAALWQQPAPTTAQPRERRAAAWDSTTSLVVAVGLRVAEVKSGLELYRRAVFNAPDAEVLSAAQVFRSRCHSLDSVAVVASRRVCRSCAERSVQAALDAYRAELPAVGRVGARCAQQLARLSRGTGAAPQLRHDVRIVGNPIVAGLGPYERRLATLRVAAHWAPMQVPPPRPGGR